MSLPTSLQVTKEFLNEVFDYVDGKLFWKKVFSNRVKVGDEAGTSLSSSGYKKVGFLGKEYRVHRIIWAMFNNDTESFIDHIDGDKLNNRIENLRASDKSTNGFNRGKTAKNKTGYKGVHFETCTQKYRASITAYGVIHRLGRFNTAEEAHKAYCEAALKLHGEYARIT